MQRYNEYKTNLKGGTLSSINPCMTLGAKPDTTLTRVDTRPRTPFLVRLIYSIGTLTYGVLLYTVYFYLIMMNTITELNTV